MKQRLLDRVLLPEILVAIACSFIFIPAVYGAEPPAPAAIKKPGVAAPVRKLPQLPGIQAGGQVLLPNQWSIKPAGKQVVLGDFPVHVEMHPVEDVAAVLHAGYGAHEIVLVDLKTKKVKSRATVPQAYYGLHFSANGDTLWAGGGEDRVVHQFKYNKGYLLDYKKIVVGRPNEKIVVCGVATAENDTRLYAALTWGDAISVTDLTAPETSTRIGLPDLAFPYGVLPSPDGKRLFVSLWGKSAVAVVDTITKKVTATWKTDAHPTEMLLSPDGKRLFVACANSNSVTILNTQTGAAMESVHSALYARAPVGSTPNSIALGPDGNALLIANADNHNVAVFDVSKPGAARSLGHIPAGWYPTSVRFAHDGKVLIANGKGITPKPNRHGPNPLLKKQSPVREYIGGLFQGTLSVIDPPTPKQMAAYAATALKLSPLRADLAPVTSPPAGSPVPGKVGGKSPIKHCIYIVKENRTYDQVFGDMKQGNGDPSLCIFPRKVTPNHHALAEEFVLLDNFYVESEVSVDGHEWSMAAYATDFVEKSWPLLYRGGRGTIPYPAEGRFTTIAPSSGGYIWDNCKRAGVSFRSYGEFITNPAKLGDPATARVKTLEGHFDPYYRSYDLDYPDVKRAARFIEELHRYEKEGGFPQFIVLRLPNDHTYGVRADKPTPTAMVADNDLALGRVVEAVSKSKFWPETAIFVVEDDAQNGSDHVDAHRTVAMVISPYTKRGFVDSTMYSTSSMLRSMELILGLPPMSQFDAAARPMYNAFNAKPNLKPYQHRPANVDLTAVNHPNAWGSKLSQSFDLSREDAADDLLLNEVIWRSIKGAGSPMPPPVRASFVFSLEGDEDDDDDEDENEDQDDDDDDDEGDDD